MYCFLTESAPEVVSATSCTWNPYHGNFGGSCTAAAGKGMEVFQSETFKCEDQLEFVVNYFLLSHQAPVSLAFPGTALPLQGPTARRPREAKVEGSRALWKILKEAETDPMSYQIPPLYPSSDDSYFLFWWIVGSVFLLFPFFKTSLCRFLNKTDL